MSTLFFPVTQPGGHKKLFTPEHAAAIHERFGGHEIAKCIRDREQKRKEEFSRTAFSHVFLGHSENK